MKIDKKDFCKKQIEWVLEESDKLLKNLKEFEETDETYARVGVIMSYVWRLISLINKVIPNCNDDAMEKILSETLIQIADAYGQGNDKWVEYSKENISKIDEEE